MIRTVFSVAVAAGALTFAISAAEAADIGAKYGSREPHTCASRAEPAEGPISAAEAKQYLQCDEEREMASSSGTTLYLITNVSVQVGTGRPFMMGSDDTGDNMDDGIDPHFTVYPIRGSFVQWACSSLDPEFAPAGKNCIRQDMPHAAGICFVSSFKEWHCHMQDISQPMQSHQPAPTTD